MKQLIIPDGWEWVGYQVPKRGMGIINTIGKFSIVTWDTKGSDMYACFRKVEPIDHELESAKKKFPVGSWVMCPSRDTHAVYKVSKVDRNSYLPDIILVHGGVYTCEVSLCTPFPLPVWRCCATDKPKKSGEYAMRSKGSKKIFSVKYSIATAFWDRTSVIDCPYSDFEWLDEGER